MKKNIMLICYIPTKKIIEKISIFLLKKKISNYILIFKNIKSIYTYKKKICKETEFKITINTKTKFKNTIITFIKKIHPYKYPNITILYKI